MGRIVLKFIIRFEHSFDRVILSLDRIDSSWKKIWNKVQSVVYLENCQSKKYTTLETRLGQFGRKFLEM